MNISVDEIKNQLQVILISQVKSKVGRFLNYTVKVLNRSLELVRQVYTSSHTNDNCCQYSFY